MIGFTRMIKEPSIYTNDDRTRCLAAHIARNILRC